MSNQSITDAAGSDRDYAHQEIDHGLNTRKIGNVIMEMKNITQRFGGLTAIKDVSSTSAKARSAPSSAPMGQVNRRC